MPSKESSGRTPLRQSASHGLKIVIVGGFGVGKTTMVSAVSEIRPLSTEEIMTRAGVGIDENNGVSQKNTTTVAFDFGRITVDDETVLYLFGAPGQERFWYVWDHLFSGSLGAVVLVDTRRIADSWYAIDRLEHHQTPFVVALNRFEGPHPSAEKVRKALALSEDVPVVDCDARDRESSKHVLITLVRHLAGLPAAQASTAQSLCLTDSRSCRRQPLPAQLRGTGPGGYPPGPAFLYRRITR